MDTGDLCGSSNALLLKGIKLLRTLRLVKLVRVLRASRIVQRWETSVSISTSTRSVIQAVVGFCVLIHWMACGWALLPQLMPELRNSPGLAEALTARIETDITCTACLCDSDPLSEPCRNPCLTLCEIEVLATLTNVNTQLVHNSESWMCRAVRGGYLTPDFQEQHSSTWIASLLVAMLQLLGGVGQINPTNDAESILFVLAILIGTIVFAGVQGVVIRVLTTGNPDEILFKQNLDALNYMMRDQRIPQPTRVRVRDYFLKTKQLQKRESYFELIDACLSRKLRGDIRYLISCKVFESVWWLSECEAEFLKTLSNFVEREAFAREEKVANMNESGEYQMCILDQGVASRAGVILTSGAHWGDLLISSDMLRDTRSAKALGYCEVVTLTKSSLDEASYSYPVSRNLIRLASLKLATQRAMVVISMYVQLWRSRIADLKRRAETAHADDAAAAAAAVSALASLPVPTPTTALLAMRNENLMADVDWREVQYTTDERGKAVPLALRDGDDGAAEGASPELRSSGAKLSEAEPSPDFRGLATPDVEGAYQGSDEEEHMHSLPPASKAGGKRQANRRAQALASMSAMPGMAAQPVQRQRPRESKSPAGGANPAVMAKMARSQAQTAQAVSQLSAEMARLREMMEVHLRASPESRTGRSASPVAPPMGAPVGAPQARGPDTPDLAA